MWVGPQVAIREKNSDQLAVLQLKVKVISDGESPKKIHTRFIEKLLKTCWVIKISNTNYDNDENNHNHN